jgi:biopolymer transport protein ExbD
MYKVLLLLIMASASAAACAVDGELEQAVENFCESYNPKTWSELDSNASSQEIHAEIQKGQAKTIRHKGLQEAIATADTTDFAAFYYSVKHNIESLLGEPWHCPYFEEFYLPARNVLTLSLGEVSQKRINPQGPDTLIVAVSGRKVIIDNAPVKAINADSLEAALESRLQGKDISKVQVVVYLDAGADGSLATAVLKALASVGVKTVDLLDYP